MALTRVFKKSVILKSLFYKSYEVGFIKSSEGNIVLTVYQENFQTLIGSKDGVTPFDFPIVTEFEFKFQAEKYIKRLIDKELLERKLSNKANLVICGGAE